MIADLKNKLCHFGNYLTLPYFSREARMTFSLLPFLLFAGGRVRAGNGLETILSMEILLIT